MAAKWTRSELAAEANDLSSQSRRKGAPKLTAASSDASLLEWLEWADPNGEWGSDEATETDTSDLWEAVATMVESA